MPRYLIEREIPNAQDLTPEQLAEIARTSNAAVDSLGVPYTWVAAPYSPSMGLLERERELDVLARAFAAAADGAASAEVLRFLLRRLEVMPCAVTRLTRERARAPSSGSTRWGPPRSPADPLFISPRTTDHHVSAVLSKLGMANRRAVVVHRPRARARLRTAPPTDRTTHRGAP